MLLGDGSFVANDLAYFRWGSKRLEYLKWFSDELRWLTRGITYDSSEIYRLRTTSHPNLWRYWTWMEAPSTGHSQAATSRACSIGYDGTLSFGGTTDVSQITFAAKADAKREAIAHLLAQRCFKPIIWDRGLRFSSNERNPGWIGLASVPRKRIQMGC